MPTSGTENAAVIWTALHTNGAEMTEAEVRLATRLSVGTVNRLLRAMAHQGMVERQEATDTSVTRYKAVGTIDKVRAAFSRRRPEREPPRRSNADVLSHFQPGMRRVSSVWDLGAAL